MNQKGLTMVELLISLVILMVITTAAFKFFEEYGFETRKFGEYLTAKHITIAEIEQNKNDIIKNGLLISPQTKQVTTLVNGTKFNTVIKINEIKNVYLKNENTKFLKLTVTTYWDGKELEVSSYVSER